MWQLVGVRHPEDGTALHRGEGAQTDPVRQVRLQPPQASLLQFLRGEQQVDAERPADAPDLDEHVDEVRPVGEQLGELVDDQDQTGQRGERHPGRAGALVVPRRGIVAGLAQQLLTPGQLALDGAEHAVDQRLLVLQVGDHGGGVRQPVQRGERRATLVVDQHEVQDLRVVGHRERHHQRAQQLRLAGTGRADQQAVRAHAVLRGLLQVQLDRTAVGADADRHTQTVAIGPVRPHVGQLDLVRIVHLEQLGEPHVLRDRGLVTVGRRGEPQRRQLAREHLDLRQPERVGPADLGGTVHGRTGDGAVRGDLQDHRAVVEQPGRRHRQVEDGDTGDPALGHQVVGPGRRAAVDDHHHVRAGRRRAHRVEAGAVDQHVVEHRLERGNARRDQPDRAGRVRLVRVLGVRQPLRPLPAAALMIRHADADAQVVRRVEGGDLGGQRTTETLHALVRTAQVDVREVAQGDGDRQVGHDRVGVDELAQRHRAERLQLVHRAGLRRDQAGRHLLHTDRDPHDGEVGVVAPPLPEAGVAGSGLR